MKDVVKKERDANHDGEGYGDTDRAPREMPLHRYILAQVPDLPRRR